MECNQCFHEVVMAYFLKCIFFQFYGYCIELCKYSLLSNINKLSLLFILNPLMLVTSSPSVYQYFYFLRRYNLEFSSLVHEENKKIQSLQQ